jgi:GNAT superfamily N-acetyltransferase
MEARVHEDVREFWSIASPLYLADPIRHTFTLTVSRRLLDAPDPSDLPPVLLTAWDGIRLVGASFRAPPWPMGTSGLPEDACEAAASMLLKVDPELPSVSGPRDTAEPFAELWSKLTGTTIKEAMAGRLYRLAHLEPPVLPGHARAAAEDDVALLAGWRRDFQIEAMGHERVPGSAESDLRRSMAVGSGHVLWEVDGRVVSYAAAGAPINGMSRVGPVYTPRELRGRGYGTAVTSAATQWALDAGAENVLLLTDLANSTSNSIYQRIGYRPVLDTTELEFQK